MLETAFPITKGSGGGEGIDIAFSGKGWETNKEDLSGGGGGGGGGGAGGGDSEG